MHACAPLPQGRVSERFHDRTLRTSLPGTAFWLVLLLVYSLAHFFLISVPIATGFTSMQLLFSTGAASLSEYVFLMLALWVPVVPISAVLVDVFFQLVPHRRLEPRKGLEPKMSRRQTHPEVAA